MPIYAWPRDCCSLCGELFSRVATISGGSEDDNIINNGTGSATITGGAGNDTILGGLGFNNIDGGTGNDMITGRGIPGDWLRAGGDADTIQATGGRSRLYIDQLDTVVTPRLIDTVILVRI
jgi:Ca2+-binding RTX toxin-like protein